MGAATLAVTDQTFQNEVLSSDVPVLVDFWAEWCAPCVALSPVIEQLATEYAGKAKVVKLNIDEARETSIKFGIRSIPTVAIFKGGQVVDMRVGLTTRDDLAARLNKALA